MFESLLPVVVGGLIAIAGSAAQAIINSKHETTQHHRAKREEAYLEFIDALLSIEIDYQSDKIDTHDFWTKFNSIQAKLNLYGSKQIIQLTREFQWHLNECWENHYDKGTEIKKWYLVNKIRKELKIKS